MSVNILAIDAATEACSVALTFNGQIYSRFEICPQQHSQRILPLVDEVLQQAGCRLQDLDLLAYGRGPGSFTGVRIGVGVAQGLAFGADLVMVGISTLQTMAQGALEKHQAQRVVAAIDARMGEIYVAEYQQHNGIATLVGEERVTKPDLFESVFAAQQLQIDPSAVGTGWQTYPQLLAEKIPVTRCDDIIYPDALMMLPLAQYALANNLHITSPEDAQPVYVRDTVTWQKLPGRV